MTESIDIPRKTARFFVVPSVWLHNEDSRIDATTYGEGGVKALRTIEASPFPKESFGKLCGTIWHPVQNQARSNFKRIYTTREHGVPFVSSKHMYLFPLRPDRFLSRRMQKLGDLMVPEGWILLSRSGTVGNLLYVNRGLARCAISDHTIRIQPVGALAGYLYAFLSSSIGQGLVTKSAYGSTVDELEPKHIASIPVPRVPLANERQIHDQIVQAYQLRDEANTLLEQVDEELHKLIGVSPFSEDDIEYVKRNSPVKAFVVTSAEMQNALGAANNVPITRSAIHKLGKGRYPLVALRATGTDVNQPPRFKRVYVDRGDGGIPFFQPSFVPMMKPLWQEYVSPKTDSAILADCMLKPGSILMTRSGTAGRVCLVTTGLAKWAGSDDLIRIFPSEQFDPGFLTAFLLTPYARHQVLGQLYGGVIDHVDVPHVANVLIPSVPIDQQRAIGEKVLLAYSKKDLANELEATAIQTVEALIMGQVR